MDTALAIGASKDPRRVAHRHDDAALIDAAARALRAVLRRGGAVVWIGTDTGLRWLKWRLTDLGVDIVDRRVLWLDKTRTLAEITVDGLPDTARFARAVGAQIDGMANRHAHVAIFTETAKSGASAFEALLKSFAQSRAVFSYRAYRAPVCRCEPTVEPGRNRWSLGEARPSLAIPLTPTKECT